LPKPGRRKKPEPAEHKLLQAMNLADLIELAEGEKIELEGARTRREVFRAITMHRLTARIPVIADGLLDVVPEGHAFLRSSANDYMPSLEDVFVPPSLVRKYELREGMTLRGELRPAREGEVLFCLRTVAEL